MNSCKRRERETRAKRERERRREDHGAVERIVLDVLVVAVAVFVLLAVLQARVTSGGVE